MVSLEGSLVQNTYSIEKNGSILLLESAIESRLRGSSSKEYAKPPLYLPAGLSLGVEWSYEDANGDTHSQTVSRHLKSLKLPNGLSFKDVIVIKEETGKSPYAITKFNYWAPEIGLVGVKTSDSNIWYLYLSR